MTDAHCHVSCGDASVREFLIGRDFFGIHPWDAEALSEVELATLGDDLCARLSEHAGAGVGEIGLDRLRTREISSRMREVFERQLQVACERGCPVVLHGAKCWGQVVDALTRRMGSSKAAFLFHGFSRSEGLLSQIVVLNGYVSVGPAILNDHAVNYRALVKKIPLDRILLETDRTPENASQCPTVDEVLVKTAEILGLPAGELESRTDENASRFKNDGAIRRDYRRSRSV